MVDDFDVLLLNIEGGLLRLTASLVDLPQEERGVADVVNCLCGRVLLFRVFGSAIMS